MHPPTTLTGLKIAPYKSSPAYVECLKLQTPSLGINVSIKSKSPSDMHFWSSNRGQENPNKSIGPTNLTDLGYSSATMTELFPNKRSLFQAMECNETSAVETTSQVLDGDNEKIEIIISYICDSTWEASPINLFNYTYRHRIWLELYVSTLHTGIIKMKYSKCNTLFPLYLS